MQSRYLLSSEALTCCLRVYVWQLFDFSSTIPYTGGRYPYVFFMKLLFRWVLNAGTLLLLAYYLPGIDVSGWYAAFITALVLGLVNAVIRPVLVAITLPITVLSLGLFSLLINALPVLFCDTVL